MWPARPSNNLSQGTGTMNGTFQNKGINGEKTKEKTYTREKAGETKSIVNSQSLQELKGKLRKEKKIICKYHKSQFNKPYQCFRDLG